MKFEFTFLSLNTMGAPFKKSLTERYKKMALSIQESEVDFLGLQETFKFKKTNLHLLNPLSSLGFMAATAHQFKWFKFKTTGSGLTTLSKHPILEQAFHSFKAAKSVDRLSSKGILLTRLFLNQKIEIDFYNTHLQASYLYRHQNAKTRIKQLNELAEFIHKRSSPKNVVILAGDFNFKETSQEYAFFKNKLWQDKDFEFVEVMRHLNPDLNTHPLYTYQHLRRKKLKEKIDHLFLHVGQNSHWLIQESHSQILDWKVSDHAPVITKLVFETNTSV